MEEIVPSDIPIIEKALCHYKKFLIQSSVSERTPSTELSNVASLIYRLGRSA